MKITKTVFATVALLAGGIIYILWRSETLLMFSWFDALGMRPPIETLRGYAAPYAGILPRWVIFCLPQALWLFSGILFFHCIWHRGSAISYALWTAVFVAIAFGVEAGQFLRVVPGYFAAWDVLLLLLASLSAWAIVGVTSHREKRVQL